MLKTAFFLKQQLTATKTKFDGNTQNLRRDLIIDLLFLKEYASRRAKDQRLNTKNRLKWMHITGEISRTINYITKDFDAIDTKKRIESLRKILDTEFNEII